jgi:hypothetical protein
VSRFVLLLLVAAALATPARADDACAEVWIGAVTTGPTCAPTMFETECASSDTMVGATAVRVVLCT